MTTKRDETVVDFQHVERADDAPTGREAWRLSDERLPLFSVTSGDDEREFVTMPAKPNPGLALDFLRMGRRIGPELAISWLIEEAIGADGYDSLVTEMETYEGDGSKLLGAIGEKIQRVVMGGLESPKA